MVWLTGISLTSTYAADILGPLILLGAGLGLVFSPALASATFGVEPRDAGVASATANTTQQVGGSIGTALLNSIAASVATRYATARISSHVSPSVIQAEATVHSFQVVFWISAGIYGVGAVVCFALLRFGAQQGDMTQSAPGV